MPPQDPCWEGAKSERARPVWFHESNCKCFALVQSSRAQTQQHDVKIVHENDKLDTLYTLLRGQKVVVFASTNEMVDELVRKLRRVCLAAGCMLINE